MMLFEAPTYASHINFLIDGGLVLQIERNIDMSMTRVRVFASNPANPLQHKKLITLIGKKLFGSPLVESNSQCVIEEREKSVTCYPFALLANQNLQDAVNKLAQFYGFYDSVELDLMQRVYVKERVKRVALRNKVNKRMEDRKRTHPHLFLGREL